MHVVLINPGVPKPTFDSTCAQLPPLGLLYIAAVLENEGHSVSVIDAELFSYSPQEVVERIAPQTRLVGLGGTTFQAQEAFAIASLVREAFPECRIAYGGPHASALKYAVFDLCPAVDHVILGPGEIPVRDLVNGASPEQIPGCLTRGAPVSDSPAFAEAIPFEEQPLPARHLVPIRAYTGAGRLPFVQTSMMITRGCPFRCMFCSSTVWGKVWDKRSIPSIIKELYVLKEYGFSEIFFQDDTINVDVDWAINLFQAVTDENIGLKYKLCLRVNEKMLPEKLFVYMTNAGVEHIFFGVESADDNIRNTVSKGITKDEVRRAVALAKKYHIDTTLAFIVGLPGETEKSVAESIEFVKELRPYEAGFSVAIPFPGSRLRQWAADNHYLVDDSLQALCPGKAVMRTDELAPHEIENLRKVAELQSAPSTSRTVTTAEDLCDHLVGVLLHFEREPNCAEAVDFVRMALARAGLDVKYGCETTIWVAQRLLGGKLSKYHRAKMEAMLGIALVQFGQKSRGVPFLYSAEKAAFDDISDWCREKYAEYGLGDGNFISKRTIKDFDEDVAALLVKTFASQHATFQRIAVVGKIGKICNAVAQFDTLENFFQYCATEKCQYDFVFLSGIFSQPMNEVAALNILVLLKEYSSSGTIFFLLDAFGNQYGDTLRFQEKNISRDRLLELSGMAGLTDVTFADGCLVAVSGLYCNYEFPLDGMIILHHHLEEFDLKKYVLCCREKLQKILRKKRLNDDWFLGKMAAVISDERYSLLLRYSCALEYQLEDYLYTASRTVDYHGFGQWHIDYSTMVRNALDLFGKRILDFGCAYGTHVLGYRMVGVDAVGVDVNSSFIGDALPLVSKYLHHFSAENSTLLLSIFSKGSFSAIIANEVFEHVPHAAKKEYIRIFENFLSPGGYCVVTCPTGVQEFEDVYGGGVFTDPQHSNLLEDSEMCRYFCEAGFEDVSESYREKVRAFVGAEGFSFWRTYCAYDKYFCFQKKGDCSPVWKYPVKGMFVKMMMRFHYKTFAVQKKTRKILKSFMNRMVGMAAWVLPKFLKEKIKKTACYAALRRIFC